MCRRLALAPTGRFAVAVMALGGLVPKSNSFTCRETIRHRSSNTNYHRSGTRNRSSVSIPVSSSSNTSRAQHALLLAKDNKGVYSRPSAAIERGSGFFIPGLEGPRVRLVFGLIVLLLIVLNHVLLSSSLPTVAFSEGLAGVYAILLLFQAAIEFGKEEKGFIVTLEKEKSAADTSTSASSFSQTWSSSSSSSSSSALSEEAKEKVQWAAASYVSLTPASHMLLLEENDGVVYRLGSTPATTTPTSEMEGTKAAFQALEMSSSGRVSLPLTHPAVTSLSSEEHGRCVVLQRINESKCWMMTSNQLLAAFTKEDLKWLGQLAKHVAN